jgi:Cu+-exporting ATPase
VVQVTELKEGDLIEVRNREVIPADAILLSADAAIDYSFVTGEAEAILKKEGDRIYAGGRQVGHPIQLRVIKEVSQSYLTQLWNSDTFQQQSKYETLINHISKYFTLGVLLIASLTAIYWYFVEPSYVLNAVTAVLIVACPCALSLATPFTLGNAMTILGKHKFYLKHTTVLEQLWSISRIVFDKTGTLTKGTSGNVHFHGRLTQEEKNLIGATSAASTHPLSRMINAETYTSRAISVTEFTETEGKGIRALVDGHEIALGSAEWIGASEVADEAMVTKVYLSIDNKKIGHYTFGNVYRTKVEDTLALVSGYNLTVISGDNESERENLTTLFPVGTEMLFGQKPENKLAYIKERQLLGERVVMLGDGLNDAGALKQAEVGIAVTEDVSAFTPASDAILYGGNFHQFGTYLKFAQSTRQIIIASFTISFLYNIVGLSFAVTANLTPLFAAILMPLSSISVVAFATFVVRGLAYRLNL